MAPDPSSADIILNKAALLIAKNQRLVSSWLPPPVPSSEPPKSEAEIEKEEQEIFGTPLPELFGIGATLPKDGDVKRQDLSSNEKLRKQMLGNDYAKRIKQSGREGAKSGKGLQGAGSKPRPASTKREGEDESEEDEGRTALGKLRRDVKRRRVDFENEADVDATVDGEEAGGDFAGDSKPQKKASNYLDEVLAERSQKKRKKNKKKKHKRQIAES